MRLTLMKARDVPTICRIIEGQAAALADEVWQSSRKTEADRAEYNKMKKLTIPDRWYRRLITEGISYLNRQTEDRLKLIAKYFGFQLQELWQENLVEFRRDVPIELANSENSDSAVKLLKLLDTGGYPYLKPLIDALHAQLLTSK